MQLEQVTSKQIYAYIERYIEEHGYAPSIRNIADACQMGKTTVHYHIEKLEALGWLQREPGVARSLLLLHDTELDGSS